MRYCVKEIFFHKNLYLFHLCYKEKLFACGLLKFCCIIEFDVIQFHFMFIYFPPFFLNNQNRLLIFCFYTISIDFQSALIGFHNFKPCCCRKVAKKKQSNTQAGTKRESTCLWEARRHVMPYFMCTQHKTLPISAVVSRAIIYTLLFFPVL